MKTIYLLPDLVISQIAAGEVIERPSYAIKELIDNSLDAKATKISIDLVDSGLTKMIVTDNGIGMTKEDLLESYKLHTTSKIRNIDTLLSIKSLGFRGEALSSIASVSDLTIESRTREDAIGTRIELRHGQLHSVSSLGMPEGTRVIISNIFESIPARRKFLKSKRTEMKHMLDIIAEYALSLPAVSWFISHDGKPLMTLPENRDAKERIQTLLGQSSDVTLFPLVWNDSYISIQGFLATPQSSSGSMSRQYLSINGRPVQNRLVALAVKEAYGVLLPKDTTPSYFLTITIPFETVDVNIHPRKTEVRFTDERFIFDAVYRSVAETVQKYNLTYRMQFTPEINNQKPKLTDTPIGRTLKKSVLPWNTTLISSVEENDKVLQLENVYIVATTPEGVLIVDQHAAHERILYEKFSQEFLYEKKKLNSKELSEPMLIDIAPIDIPIFEELLPDLIPLGFVIVPFSGSTFRIEKIPSILIGRNAKLLIVELLQEKQSRSYVSEIDTGSKRLLAFLACKSAVKSGDPLTIIQMKDILSELKKIPHAVTCPHGRPTVYEVPLVELHKLFKRS